MKAFHTSRFSAQEKQQHKRHDGSEQEPWNRSRYRRRRYKTEAAALCEGCEGRFAEIDGPLHAYLTVSAGCWARFGQSLALHYFDPLYWPAHQLLTDAYVLQHSRGSGRRSIRSVHVHLAALYAQLCLGQPDTRVCALRRALAEFDFNPLSQPWPAPSRSIAIVDFSAPDRHLSTVTEYARSVLADWEPFHVLAERLCRV